MPKKDFSSFSSEWKLLALLLSVSLASVLMGAYKLSPSTLGQAFFGNAAEIENYLVWQVRIPRILMAIVVGGGLATTGAAIQGLFRNPLAEPTLVGMASGAMLFAVIALLFCSLLPVGLPTFFLQSLVSIAAFFGALLSTVLVYKLANRQGKTNITTMLLAGIAITSLAGSFTGLMIYGSDENELRDISFWTMGSLSGATWKQLTLCFPITAIGAYFLHRNSLALNAFLLGEREASNLGFDVQRIKQQTIIWTALIVGICISFTGLIGFVGLVIPHLIRLRIGTDYRKLIVCSLLLGGSFLLLADSVARTVIAPAELPIGILTSMVGAPFFIWLLLKH